MIQPNEIMIGNLFNVPNTMQCPFRVDEIEHLDATFGKFSQRSAPDRHPLTWYLKDLSGIPITEEWLLRFGFEYIGDGEYSLQLGRCRALLYRDDQMYLIYGEDAETTETVHCEFFHQFQNLYFALTGLELNPEK